MPDTRAVYRPTARILHWIVALLVLATIPVGQIMTQEGLARPLQNTLYIFHKNTGVLILLLVLARLGFRAFNPPPPLPASVPWWQQRIARATHWLLYVLLIVMAVSGYIRVKAGGFPIEYLDALGVPSPVPKSEPLEKAAQATHATVRILLIAVIALHVSAAAYHGLIRRDGVFSRMWPWGSA